MLKRKRKITLWIKVKGGMCGSIAGTLDPPHADANEVDKDLALRLAENAEWTPMDPSEIYFHDGWLRIVLVSLIVGLILIKILT